MEAKRFKVIQSGNLLEVFEYELPIILDNGKELGQQDQETKEWNEFLQYFGLEADTNVKEYTRRTRFNRIRNNIRRLVHINFTNNSVFLTLTFKENIMSVETGNARFSLFIKRLTYFLDKKRGNKFKYLAVVQFQDGKRKKDRQGRGVVHYHLLMNRRVNFRVISELWGQGFVWLENIRNVKQMGAYICKYIVTPTDDRLDNKKAYWCSRNIKRPIQVYLDNIKTLVQDSKQEYYSEYSSKYNGIVKYAQFKFLGSTLCQK